MAYACSSTVADSVTMPGASAVIGVGLFVLADAARAAHGSAWGQGVDWGQGDPRSRSWPTTPELHTALFPQAACKPTWRNLIDEPILGHAAHYANPLGVTSSTSPF